MRVCFLCTIFSRLLCGNFLFDSAALQSSLCSVVQIQYLTSLIAAEHFPGKSRRVTRKTLPVSSSDISETYTVQMLRCARTGLYFSFIPQETVYIQSPVHRLYSVCCQSCFDIYRTTSVISLIISVKFQINLHTFACTHTCLCPSQLVCSPL